MSALELLPPANGFVHSEERERAAEIYRKSIFEAIRESQTTRLLEILGREPSIEEIEKHLLRISDGHGGFDQLWVFAEYVSPNDCAHESYPVNNTILGRNGKPKSVQIVYLDVEPVAYFRPHGFNGPNGEFEDAKVGELRPKSIDIGA